VDDPVCAWPVDELDVPPRSGDAPEMNGEEAKDMSRTGSSGSLISQRLGWPLLLVALVPIALDSGERLLERRARAAEVERHRANAEAALTAKDVRRAVVALQRAHALDPFTPSVRDELLDAQALLIAQAPNQPFDGAEAVWSDPDSVDRLAFSPRHAAMASLS
jgi:hypothetical protein